MTRAPVPCLRAIVATAALACILPASAAAQETVNVELTPVTYDHVIEELPLTGTVTARQRAALSSRTSGLVAAVHVDAGDHVTAGTVLLTLDDTLARLAVERTEAALAEARIRQSENERLRDETRLLLEQRTIAETEAQTRESEARMAAAAARQLDVEVRERRELLARHSLVAPFDGVVTNKLTDAGEWVDTGRPVLELVATDHARIDVQVPQERLAGIQEDTPVEIRLDALTGPAVRGRVTARVPVSDPAARTALVRVEPEDASVPLLPGKSARITFLLRSATPVLSVPRDALVRRPDGTVNVWVATRAGEGWTATQRRVDLGRAFSDRLEVRAGLEAGEHVVLRGNETLRAGQPLLVRTSI